jgi:hypothetical protein
LFIGRLLVQVWLQVSAAVPGASGPGVTPADIPNLLSVRSKNLENAGVIWLIVVNRNEI